MLRPDPKPAGDMFEAAGRKYIQDAQPQHYERVGNPDGTTFTVRRRVPKVRGKAARKAVKRARREA